MKPEQPITVEDLQGSWVQAMPGDRTPAGGKLTHIGETRLPRDVNLQGGGDYMFDNPNVWASGKGVITGLNKKTTKLPRGASPCMASTPSWANPPPTSRICRPKPSWASSRGACPARPACEAVTP